MPNDTCKRCGRLIQDGDLVTGFDFSNDGGEHIHCPTYHRCVAHNQDGRPCEEKGVTVVLGIGYCCRYHGRGTPWPTDADISQCVIASLQEDSGV